MIWNAVHVWTLGIISLLVAIGVCVLVLERMISIVARLKNVEAEQTAQWKRIGDCERGQEHWTKHSEQRAAAATTRFDALEKRPPLVNVAVQMQPAAVAAKPKAGAK